MRYGPHILTVLALAVIVGCDKKQPASPSPIPSVNQPTASITCNGQPTACTINHNGTATIAWSSTSAESCSVAAGGWSGTSGSQSTGALTASRDYEVRCSNSVGQATASVRVNVGTLPRPGAFSFSASCVAQGSANQARLSWSQSSNADRYRIERRAWSSGIFNQITVVNGMEFVDTVPNNTDFYYRVVAVNSTGETVSTPPELEVCSQVNPPPPPPPAGPPGIFLTFVPAKGSTQDLNGRVQGVDPSSHKVVVYIRVGVCWWIKPFDHSPLTNIRPDGSWTADITTGGMDTAADEILAVLVTNSHSPFIALCATGEPVSVNGADVLALTRVNR